MLLSNAITELQNHVDSDGAKVLQEIIRLVKPIHHSVQAKHIRHLLLQPADTDALLAELETLKAAFKLMPVYPGHEHTIKTDLRQITTLLATYIRLGDYDQALWLIDQWDAIFTPSGSEKCNMVVTRCPCGHKNYEKVAPYCGECNRARHLCVKNALPNGRCRFHGGRQSTADIALVKTHNPEAAVLPGRAAAYVEKLTNIKLHRAIEAAVAGQNTLSMAPEIGIIGHRAAELISRAEGEALVASNIGPVIKELEKAYTDDDYDKMREGIEGLIIADQARKDSDAQWREALQTIRALKEIIQQEQSRIVAATRMVTAQEMLQLRQQTVYAFRAVIATATERLTAHYEKLLPDQVRDDLERKNEKILTTAFGDVMEKQRKMEQRAAYMEGIANGQ